MILSILLVKEIVLWYIVFIMKTTTHALGHMMYGYSFLVPMNQGVLSKLSKEYNISGHKSSKTHRVLKPHRSKMSIIIYMFS